MQNNLCFTPEGVMREWFERLFNPGATHRPRCAAGRWRFPLKRRRSSLEPLEDRTLLSGFDILGPELPMQAVTLGFESGLITGDHHGRRARSPCGPKSPN
jgi:hypothetical protein